MLVQNIQYYLLLSQKNDTQHAGSLFYSIIDIPINKVF